MEGKRFEQIHIEDTDNPIGLGGEKKVYNDKTNPDRVIGLYRPAETREGYPTTERQVKARFYLIKIAHLLFPQNIPDAQFSYSKPNAMARTKVDLSEDHKRLNNIAIVNDDLESEKVSSGSREDIKSKLLHTEINYSDKIAANPGYEKLVSKLQNAGYKVDATGINFDMDSNGEVIFLDEFSPWRIDPNDKEVTIAFDKDKLQEAINKLPEKEQEQAQSYLDRTLVNFQEELNLLNHKV